MSEEKYKFEPWLPDSHPAQNIHLNPEMKLGLKLPLSGRVSVPLHEFLHDMPEYPKRFDLTTRIPSSSPTPMGANDKVGDCADVAVLNFIRTATADDPGHVGFKDPEDYLALYTLDAGYDPAQGDGDNNPTDRGTDVDMLLNRMVRTGYLGHKFDAAAGIDIRKTDQVLSMLYNLNGGLFDFYLPRKVFEMGDRWDVPKSSADENDIIGGHCVHCNGFGELESVSGAQPESTFVYSWGRRIEVTPAFRARYGIRAHAILSKETINPNGYTMSCLDYPGIVAAYKRLTGLA